MALDRTRLGGTGIEVSELALGTWWFGTERDGSVEIPAERAHELLDAYADRGGNFIDTADRYGGGRSEEIIGDWLAGRDREAFVVASKVGRATREREDLSRKHLRRGLDGILDRLGTDHLDVLYAHRWDADTGAEAVMRTLDDFVRDGRVHHLGVSTFEPDAWRVARANEIARREGLEPFAVAQPPYNLAKRDVERNYLPMCRSYGLAVVPYNPLGEGFLTGKYDADEPPPAGTRAAWKPNVVDRYFDEANFELVDLIADVARAVGATPAQVSIAWLCGHPDVAAPVVGGRTVDQLEENLGAADLSLTDEQRSRLDGFFDETDGPRPRNARG